MAEKLRPIEKFWYVSPLTRRILAVNIAALMVLALGLLYTGQYEKNLVSFELDALGARAQMYAAALSVGGVTPGQADTSVLDPVLAAGVLKGMSSGDGTRIVLFDLAGVQLFDSHDKQDMPGIVPRAGEDTSSRKTGWAQRMHVLGEDLLSGLPGDLSFPVLPAPPSRGTEGWPGTTAALHGTAQQAAWRMSPHGKLVLTAAQPVEIFGVVRGAVSLMREGKAVEEAVRAIKVTVLRAFFFALLVTVLLTIYLSEAIVYPIVRLAHATERVRQNLLHKDSIPDLSWRGDEIGDLSRAFREMTAALDARIDSISGFAADVAHEIKNPLASVKSAIEAFAVVKDEAQRQKLLSVIHDDVNRMSRLITDISNASRLDSELSRAERHPVDLAVLVKEAVAAEGARLGDPSKILLYAEDGLRLPVSINDTQMGQVIHNLIDNALSFVTEKGKVVVSTGIREGKIYMNVDNAGSPIPEDKLEAVFERFYSERPKTEKFGMHSGLGLSICRQIVRMHRGEITAQNLKDKAGVPQGVRFTVLLPAAAGVK